MKSLVLLAAVLVVPARGMAQDGGVGPEGSKGSAVVTVGADEYLIRILCEAPDRPALGLATEPNRVTAAEAGGRTNGVRLGIRPWRDTDELLVTLDRYVAWIPRPAAAAGRLSLALDMSPSSEVRDGVPVTLTYDAWANGDRPRGLENVRIEASCLARDPLAPTYRRVAEVEERP